MTPQDFFFKNRALTLLYTYSALTNAQSLRYLRTDHGLTDIGPPRISRDPKRCVILASNNMQKITQILEPISEKLHRIVSLALNPLQIELFFQRCDPITFMHLWWSI